MTDLPIPSASAPQETQLLTWLSRLSRFWGVLTAGGLLTFLYGAGYIAVERQWAVLGVPDAAGPPDYVRAGYRFLIQTLFASLDSIREHYFIFSLIGLLCAAVLTWTPGLAKSTAKFPSYIPAITVLVLSGMALLLMLREIRPALDSLEADNLLMREVDSVKKLPPAAICVVKSVTDQDASALRDFYRRVVTDVTLAILLLATALQVTRSEALTKVWQLIHGFQVVAVVSVILTVAILPSLFGASYLATRPPCVRLEPTKELEGRDFARGENPETSLVGWLLSDVDKDPIRILATGATVRNIAQKEVEGITLEPKCNQLPSFAALSLTCEVPIR